MIAKLVLGAFLTIGSALVWVMAAQQIDASSTRIFVAAIGVLVAAWLVPLWWLVNLVLYGVATGLRHLRVTVLGDARLSEEYFAEVRERGTPWLVVAGEWGLRRSNAPMLVITLVPEVIGYLAPLLDQPLEQGLDQMRSDTATRQFSWERLVRRLRVFWATLCFAPLWGGSLWLGW